MSETLNLYKGKISVSMPADLRTLFNELSSYFLPDYFSPAETGENPDVIVSVRRGRRALFQIGKEFVIQGDYDDRQLALDGIMLCSHIGERLLLRDGMYSFHSSAVSDGTNVILLAGPSGSGKSTAALKLCRSGLKLYSTDRTILSKSDAVGGTKRFLLREGTLLYDTAVPRIKEQNQPTSTPWDKIVYINPRDIGVETDSGRREVKKVIFLRRGDHNIFRYRLDRNASLLRLYEQLLNFVDVFPNMILGQQEPLPLLPVGRERRREIIKYALSMIDHFDPEVFSGSLDSVTEAVLREMQDG